MLVVHEQQQPEAVAGVELGAVVEFVAVRQLAKVSWPEEPQEKALLPSSCLHRPHSLSEGG